MFNSTILEVGIGLIFCFCAVSLIVSSLNEALASLLKLRGKYLLAGIKTLLNDPGMRGLALELYNHAQFHPNGGGTALNEKQLENKPSYVAPRQFALALMDILQNRAGASLDLGSAIQALPDAQLRQALNGMYVRAAGDLSQMEAELGCWFDSSMQRLAGEYKRTLQLWTVAFGLLVAMVMNIDALHLFQVLWVHPALVQGISADQLANAHVAVDQLSVTELPIGWDKPPFILEQGQWRLAYGKQQLALMAAGWLITALTTLFGAPFWFDLLQRATSLRGSGPKIA